MLNRLKSVLRKGRIAYWSYRAKHMGAIPQATAANKAPILFLLPEAGIGLYIKALATIANQFKKQGHSVLFVRCYHVFDRCVFMDSESLPILASQKEKKNLCAYCFRSFEKNVKEHGLDYVDLRHFTDQSDSVYINDLIGQHQGKPFDFIYDDINFSGMLEYSLFLYLKKSSLTSFTEEEQHLWQDYLRSLFVGYKAIKKIIEQYHISNIVMCDEYSLNLIINEMCKNSQLHLTNISFPYHKDVDTHKIRIMAKASLLEHGDVIRRWNEFRPLSLTSEQIREVADDLIVKMGSKGIYAYSPTKNIQTDMLSLLGLSQDKKTIVAYPSSPDEGDAVYNVNLKRNLPLNKADDAFRDQFEWLDELIDFVEKSTDLQCVVRMHPRMAPNHREQWGCLAAQEFFTRYNATYKNVKIIWPQDKISSYDLAEIADVVTVSWSSMGNLMARLGIPVVTGLKMCWPIPHDQFSVCCNTKEQYFEQLVALSFQPPNWDPLILAYRFYNAFYLGYCISLEDSVEKTPLQEMPTKTMRLFEDVFLKQHNILETNLQELQALQSPSIAHQEVIEIRRQLCRMIHFFMTNQDASQESEFPIVYELKSECKKAYPQALFVGPSEVEYLYEGQTYKKRSPLIVRMANLIQPPSAALLKSAG